MAGAPDATESGAAGAWRSPGDAPIPFHGVGSGRGTTNDLTALIQLCIMLAH